MPLESTLGLFANHGYNELHEKHPEVSVIYMMTYAQEFSGLKQIWEVFNIACSEEHFQDLQRQSMERTWSRGRGF